MQNSTLISTVYDVMGNVCDYTEQEMNPEWMVACAEVFSEGANGWTKCYSYHMMTFTLGAADSEEYRSFLEDYLHRKHCDKLSQRSVSEMSWGNSPIAIRHIKLKLPKSDSEYSIIVGAFGGTREENTTFVSTVLGDISRKQSEIG